MSDWLLLLGSALIAGFLWLSRPRPKAEPHDVLVGLGGRPADYPDDFDRAIGTVSWRPNPEWPMYPIEMDASLAGEQGETETR